MNFITLYELSERQRIFKMHVTALLEISDTSAYAAYKIEPRLRDIMTDIEASEIREIQKNYVRELKIVKQTEEVKQIQQSYKDYLIKNHRFRNRSLLLAASSLDAQQRRFSRKELVEISEAIPAGIDFRYPTTGTIPITPASDFLRSMFLFSQNRPRDGMSKRMTLLRLMNSHKLFF